MSQKLVQTQKEEQTQQLSAVQVAFARLLELPVMDLEERVRNEMDDNEALEEAGGDEEPEDVQPDTDNHEEETDGELGDMELPEMDDQTADYLSADDVPDYLVRQNNAQEEREIQISEQSNAYDELYRQIGEQDLSERERAIMEYLIGSLDDDGYLRKDVYTLTDEMAIYHNINAEDEDVERMVRLLQTFEPRGIGAKDLQECLRIQLENPELKSPAKSIALRIINDYYKDFSLRHWAHIRQRLGISQEEMEAAMQVLLHLNPKPGSGLNESASQIAPTVIPDFYLSIDEDGNIQISLNNGDAPDLRVSRSYKDTVREFSGKGSQLSRAQKEAYIYARKKVGDAQLFIELVNRRKQTLRNVMESIAHIQQDFFRNEDDESFLVPMTLKDVAQRAGVDFSTVSRVTGSKYVRTAYGVYPLKFFFSSQFTSESGEELSSRQAKIALREIIDGENKHKPYSDEHLSKLMAEKGLPISRRTVVKYRELLGIPKSGLRKS